MTEPQGTRTLVVSKSSHEKVIKEIADSQTRVVQTLVPTILAIGLIAVAASASLGGSEGASRFRLDIVVGCTFAILFSSSIYVAALSYKIFRNGTFLSVFGGTLKKCVNSQAVYPLSETTRAQGPRDHQHFPEIHRLWEREALGAGAPWGSHRR